MYDGNETVFNWKTSPQRTLATLTECTAKTFKMRTDRVAVLFRDNASGKHDFSLFVI
jgi:hypothetical protein